MKSRVLEVFDMGSVSMPAFPGATKDQTSDAYVFTEDSRYGEALPGVTYGGALYTDTTMQQARTLLARVIARLRRCPPHAVQFLSLEGVCGGQITSAFCRAAAEQFGPILQAEPDSSDAEGLDENGRIWPDLALPRLAHTKLAIRPVDLIGRGRSALLCGRDVDLASYEMVVIEFPYGACCFDATQIASAFGGTILVAKAGVTTGYQLRAVSRAVKQAGGLVLGVALAHVPPRPSWLDRFGVG